MKINQLLLAIAFSLVSVIAQAQPTKGSVLIGGSAGFNSISSGDASITQFTFSPFAAFFISDRFAVGGQVDLQFLGGDAEGNSTGIGPLARYYFNGSGSTRFFGQGSLNWNSIDFGRDFDSQSGFGLGLGAGLDYFFNEHVALEAFLGYDYLKYQDADDPTNTIGVTIGVAAFIGGGK